jgi:acetyl-CoA carboxylase carboxyl transferase subunit beta
MNWFDRMRSGIQTLVHRNIPENIWLKCERCHQSLYRKQVEQGGGICPNCGAHFRIGHREYLRLLVDPDSFREIDAEVTSSDPLRFHDRIGYAERLRDTRKRTGMGAAVRTGVARIDGREVGLGIHEMAFIGGSLGAAEGERICRLIDRCTNERMPLILVCRSGGARMQESALSLMQMAKVTARLTRFSRAGCPYLSILSDPTTAGVAASYATLGDVTIAEPNALIGFTGERVTGGTISPEEFEALHQAQRAEHLLEHGLVDMVVRRDQLRTTLSRLLSMLCHGRVPKEATS